jgi:hypothetical protein
MKAGRRKNTGRKKRKVVSKILHVEFDKKAIEEVKKRKRGLYQRWAKRKEAV